MDLGTFGQVGLFFTNILFTIMPTDFIVVGISHTEIPTYFNIMLQFMAQWDFIFPVLQFLKFLGMALGMILILFVLEIIRFVLNVARGSGA